MFHHHHHHKQEMYILRVAQKTRQVASTYGAGMYGQHLQPQRSSVADMFVAGDFTTAAQRLHHSKMFDFDMRGYLGAGVRQQPLPGRLSASG